MNRSCARATAALAVLLWVPAACRSSAQSIAAPSLPPGPRTEPQSSQSDAAGATELQIGAELTSRGELRQAIPHLLAAQANGLKPYATGINLGICYLGTGSYNQAIAVLDALVASGLDTATVDNLLSQAYIAKANPQEALRAFRRAAAQTPKDEKLYDYLADACRDHKNYALGLTIVDQGLQQLPNSARLHYEKAVFLSQLGDFEEAGRPEFDRAVQLAPDTYVGHLALVQKDLYQDDFAAADKVLHQAIRSGQRDYRMLSLLGTVLLHEGAAPGEARFAEAKRALKESAQENPRYSATQIALGKIELMEGQPQKAIQHLEIGRRLEPDNPAVYASLATAYDRIGNHDRARQMRHEIGRLLAEKSPGSATSRP